MILRSNCLLFLGHLILLTFPPVSLSDDLLKPGYSGAGDVHYPVPGKNRENSNEPGCAVTFSSPPGLTGPPCAIRCKNLDKLGKDQGKVKSASELCNMSSEGSATITTIDRKEGKEITPEEFGDAFNSPSPSCVVYKSSFDDMNPDGSAGLFFPEGHPLCHGVSGDPHLKTADGTRFDLQAAGEFVAARSTEDNFEVQMRLEPYAGKSKTIAVVTAIAVKAGENRITINSKREPALKVNNKLIELENIDSLLLDQKGNMIIRQGKRYTVVLEDGTNVHADVYSSALNFFIPLALGRDGKLEGILGNADGDNTNDFFTSDGKALPNPPSFKELYQVFANSWRVTPETSLFDYNDGESTETFTNKDMPTKPVSLTDLSNLQIARTENMCREAGLRSGPALDECVFDYALTGDELFIDSAVDQQSSFEQKPIDKISIEAPAAGFSAHEVKVYLDGPVESEMWLGFAPKESSFKGKVRNPYSATRTKKEQSSAKLVVPTTPGEYEIRFQDRTLKKELFSLPFTALAPELSIVAPEQGIAGGSIDISLKGDIGDHVKLTVVPAGAKDKVSGPGFNLNAGRYFEGKIEKLPSEPGEYEIRLTSAWGKGKAVYARKKLVLSQPK